MTFWQARGAAALVLSAGVWLLGCGSDASARDGGAVGAAGSGAPPTGAAGKAGSPPIGGAANAGGGGNGGVTHAGGSTVSGDGGDDSSGGISSSSGAGGANGGSGAGGAPARGCKRGLAWPGKKLDDPELNAKLPWWYRWAVDADGVGSGIELVPMIWGGGTKGADVSKAIRPDAKYLLGYNEPNFFEQANLSAAAAAADWPTVEAVAQEHGLKIVSPAVNFCGDVKNKTGPCHDNEPVHYLQDFFAACADCQVDYVAVHWYNCDLPSLKWYLDQFTQFGRPIWLTEFACAIGDDTSVADNERYMREAIPYLESRADVFRYSWFSADPIPNARLLDADGAPNALGKIYLDLPHAADCAP